MNLKWSKYLICLVGFTILLQTSYIHPDEHFQSIEILIIRYLKIRGTVPWEFLVQNGARSYLPLEIFYGPLFYSLINIFKIHNQLIYLYVARF